MRSLAASILITCLLTTQARAGDWRSQTGDMRVGAFAGARLKMPLGGEVRTAPRAQLTFAPTQNRVAADGGIRTRIGEGVAINFNRAEPATVTIAGIRADSALGLRAQGTQPDGQKQGISTGGWVAIGVGSALVVGGIAFALWVDAIEDSSD